MVSNRQQVSVEERLAKIEDAANCLERERSQGLDRLKTLQTVKNTILEREQKRLTQKYGANHPRTQKVTRRLTYNQGLQRELEQEIERSKIQAPIIDSKTWLVNGRVLTQDLQGIQGLTVSLFNQNNKWVRELGFACTDERGYFAINYRPQKDISAKQPLTLTVTNAERQILHQEQQPLCVKIGLIDYREIVLDPERKTETPPEPDDSSPPGPPKPVKILSIDGPNQLPVNQPGTFIAAVSEDSTPPITLQWDFDDGTTVSGLSAIHRYAETGNYTVTFTASNSGGEDSRSITVKVRDQTVVPSPDPTNG